MSSIRNSTPMRSAALEISGALHRHGLSIDAEYAHVSADARRAIPGDGLYSRGRAGTGRSTA